MSAGAGWNVLDEDAHVLWREYAFAKNARATTLVFRGKDDELVVVSPHSNPTTRELDALKEHGRVRALVANNRWHHLGQTAWREHFRDAESYAPTGVLPKMAKKRPETTFRPLSELALGKGMRCEAAPGTKDGETFVSVPTKKGNVWYAGDLFANMQRLPPAPVKWLFQWTGSGPGYRLFKLAVFALVKDRKALRQWMLDRLGKEPPSFVVPAHGAAFEAADIVERTRAQIDRL